MTDALIVFLASYLYLVIVVLAVVSVLAVSASSDDRLALLARAVVALPLAYILGKLLGLVIVSPRPFMVEHVRPLVQASTDNGFPSDHTLLAMTVAMLIFSFNRRIGAFLLVLAALVAAGRVLALAHHPIDVIGSTVIAAVAVVVAGLVEPRLRPLLQRVVPRRA